MHGSDKTQGKEGNPIKDKWERLLGKVCLSEIKSNV